MGTTTEKQRAIITPEATASYPCLVTPKPSEEGGTPKYSLTLIFDKKAQSTPEFRALEAAAEAAKKKKWPGELPRKIRSPFLTVDDLTGKIPEGYTDEVVFIRLKSDRKPAVVGRDPTVKVDNAEIYPGMVVRASVQAFGWVSKKGGNGVSFGLGNVQIVRDGPRLGGGSAKPEDEFGALEDDEDPFK